MRQLRKPGRWAVVLCLVALGIIIYTRLARFEFAWAGYIPFERVTWRPLNMRDVPINVIFFAPFGFLLTAVLARSDRRSGLGRRVLALGLLVSVALEAAQLFLPNRVPSVIDILANMLGLALGYGLFHAWEMGFACALRRYVTPRNLLAGLAVYGLVVALLTASLRRSASLSNWETGYPLVVGNEAAGKRQWSGRVESLALTAGSARQPDFFAGYDLSGETPFEALPPSIPPLTWREGPAQPQDGAGVSVGAGEWLATPAGFDEFTKAAHRANTFSIQTDVTSADAAQRGPARIASISLDADRRNVTIGQERDALIIRLRTPASGENGTKPEIALPGVFAGGRTRHIIVTYEAPLLSVEVDGEHHALSLAPGTVFFTGFRTENRRTVPMTGDPYRYDRMYWGMVAGVALILFGGLAVAKRFVTNRA